MTTREHEFSPLKTPKSNDNRKNMWNVAKNKQLDKNSLTAGNKVSFGSVLNRQQ